MGLGKPKQRHALEMIRSTALPGVSVKLTSALIIGIAISLSVCLHLSMSQCSTCLSLWIKLSIASCHISRCIVNFLIFASDGASASISAALFSRSSWEMSTIYSLFSSSHIRAQARYAGSSLLINMRLKMQKIGIYLLRPQSLGYPPNRDHRRQSTARGLVGHCTGHYILHRMTKHYCC